MAKQYLHPAWLFAALLVSGTTQADTLFGVYGGAGSWQQDFSGDVAAGGENIDVERDLDIDRESNNVFYVGLEHGVPLLPNVRVNRAKVAGSGRSVLERTVEFRGETFLFSENVASEVSLTQTDAVFYYQVLDNVVSLDLGLTARWVDGDVEVVSDSTMARAEFKGVLPLLYGRTRVDLPLTGLWAGAEAMGLAYDGHQLVDASVQVGWTSHVGFGAELGWRTLRFELDSIDDIDDADVDISGPYFALNFHF